MSGWVRLGVNIDHVATLRQARRGKEPDPVTAAGLAELGGADGITVHLRGDRRHIQDRDVELLRQVVQSHLNIEMAATEEMIRIAHEVKPETVTLVPERRDEVTTEGGLDVQLNQAHLKRVVEQCHQVGLRVSLFIDPSLSQVKAAHRASADVVEFNTSPYVEAPTPAAVAERLEQLRECVQLASRLEIRCLAGHGLNYRNVRPVVAIEGIEELNIGHSIVARAVCVGLPAAVREMKALLERR